jgi:hypothetical protein
MTGIMSMIIAIKSRMILEAADVVKEAEAEVAKRSSSAEVNLKRNPAQDVRKSQISSLVRLNKGIPLKTLFAAAVGSGGGGTGLGKKVFSFSNDGGLSHKCTKVF